MSQLCVEPWRTCEPVEKLELEAELIKEISTEHPLHGITCQAIFRCKEDSRVLFHLQGAVFNWAVVYLTTKGEVVGDELPDVDFYLSYEEWTQRCLTCPW